MNTKNARIIFLSKCVVCYSKKSRFIKQQEASGLLSTSAIKTHLTLFVMGGRGRIPLRVELTYLIKEWGHILQNMKRENGH